MVYGTITAVADLILRTMWSLTATEEGWEGCHYGDVFDAKLCVG